MPNPVFVTEPVPLMTPDQNKATREQYLAYLRTVVAEFDLEVNTYERIAGIERDTLFIRQANQFLDTLEAQGCKALGYRLTGDLPIDHLCVKHLIGNLRVADFRLGAHDPLGQRGRGGEERARDLLGCEPADLA